jgi:formate dehydrogenase
MLMEKGVWDTSLLEELSQCMRDASICGLGQAASNPLTSVIRFFPDLFPQRGAASVSGDRT